MSLYYTQKLLYNLNRHESLRENFIKDPSSVIKDYKLTEEELAALKAPDLGLLYVMGVNGQLLMHYAGIFNIGWSEYIDQLKKGVEKHGGVRSGLYKMKDSAGDL